MMEGGQNFQNCRSWVEDIYWNHFQFLHFAQFLPSGYDQHLALPKAFSDNLKKKLPEKVGLKGPGGVVWNIGLTTRDDTLYFTHGWQQFVKDHSLRENDFLVFKFNGESTFDVLIFDGGSFCEKAAAYFVRNVGQTEHGGACLTKRKDIDNSGEEVNTHSNGGVECASPEKSAHVNNSIRVPVAVPFETPGEETFNGGVESGSPEHYVNADADAGTKGNGNGVTLAAVVPSQTTGKRIRKLVSAVNHVQTKRKGRPGRPSKATKAHQEVVSNAHQEVVNVVTDDPEPASVGKSGTYELYTSNRRPVTEYEINSAFQMAKAACTDDSLCIVMRPTHVYKRFYVSIPNKWILEHIAPRTQNVILRMVKNEWLAKYSFHITRRNGGLTGGWKHFALDNNLEEFDVCVFKPGGLVNDTLILDVYVFRVVEEITPLSRLDSPGKKVKKKAIMAIQI